VFTPRRIDDVGPGRQPGEGSAVQDALGFASERQQADENVRLGEEFLQSIRSRPCGEAFDMLYRAALA